MSFLGKLFGSKPDPVLYSPVKGEAILNDQIPDPTFAEGKSPILLLPKVS